MPMFTKRINCLNSKCMNDDNFNHDSDHHSTLEAEEANEVIKSIKLKIKEENEMAVHSDQNVWKESNVLNTSLIKDEIEEEENKIQSTIVYEPARSSLPSPPPAINIEVQKRAIPKLSINTMKKPRRIGRKPKPILSMTQTIASISTSHQDLIQHQRIMPLTQIPGIAYQISLGNNGQNSNNPVQYTMLQPQPLFSNAVLTMKSVSNPSSMVINQPYQLTQSQVLPSPKILKITPNTLNETYCLFCYKHFNNLKKHVEECWANQDRKSYKFRKITPQYE